MPVSTADNRSEPSTLPSVPYPLLNDSGSPPSAGPGAYDVTVIPPSHEARTLVLCFDGTGDQFDVDNSNIVQFFSMLKKDDKSQQMAYYQAGIGTYTIPEIATPFMARVQKTLDMALGNHLDAHVMDHAEDKICIFGFSRGAYTARALAGMIHKVGLLPAGNHQQVPFAYKMFSRDDEIGWNQSTAFKKAFSVDVEIALVGVWDTVCSVGLHRAKFKPNYYHLRHDKDQKGTKLGEMPRSNHHHPYYHHRYHDQHRNGKSHGEDNYDGGHTQTDVLEVWFSGCHCDIGGGSVPNGTRNSLARIPLRWMIRQCFLANTGIQFYREVPPPLKATASAIAELRASAHAAEPTDVTLTDQVQASPTASSTFRTEEDEELEDALSPIYDELQLSKAWWILEVLPLRHRAQKREDMSWAPYWRMNLGRPREVPRAVRERKEKVYVHRSVQIRMEAEGLNGGKYAPRAKFDHHEFDSPVPALIKPLFIF
ncbi:hypothetical protein F5148DRAFT_1167136 [Russula earlei]|uniref:Uncharacterized protein n=1 Tax=Russula earlei TaxID=71964 RepID=A0ACC0ULA8_9AGAM|nr:hypothetical protein F5148DRAFT_1167136 [Russula earlei]